MSRYADITLILNTANHGYCMTAVHLKFLKNRTAMIIPPIWKKEST